jgi:hypothetical protein
MAETMVARGLPARRIYWWRGPDRSDDLMEGDLRRRDRNQGPRRRVEIRGDRLRQPSTGPWFRCRPNSVASEGLCGWSSRPGEGARRPLRVVVTAARDQARRARKVAMPLGWQEEGAEVGHDATHRRRRCRPARCAAPQWVPLPRVSGMPSSVSVASVSTSPSNHPAARA